MLSKSEIESYKRLLEDELKVLDKELSEIAHKDSDNNWVAEDNTRNIDPRDNKEDDVNNDASDLADNQGIVNVLEVRYNNVKLALKKINENKFGICEISGEEIEKKRLDANPAARNLY